MRLKPEDVKALVEKLKAPPRAWTPELLWRTYETLEKDKVRGAEARRLLTDVVSLVRFAFHQEGELVPFRYKVEAKYPRLDRGAGGERRSLHLRAAPVARRYP
jgi:type I restriction enzyme R subunit